MAWSHEYITESLGTHSNLVSSAKTKKKYCTWDLLYVEKDMKRACEDDKTQGSLCTEAKNTILTKKVFRLLQTLRW